MPGGERGNWQGDFFHRNCKQLCLGLGYQEVFERQYSVDWAGRPVAEMGKLRPLFSPDGFTLFEYTSESNNPQGRVEKHIQVVEDFNSNKALTDEYEVAEGGVIALEWRVADALIKTALQENVFIWDYRVLGFYSAVSQVINMWRRQGMTPDHRQISGNSSFVHAFLPESRSEIRLLLLYEDILTQMNKNATRQLLKSAVSSLRKLYWALKPVYVDAHLFCMSDFTPDLVEVGPQVGFKAELLRASLDEINFRVPERPNSEFITGFRVSPWSSAFSTFSLIGEKEK